MQLENLFLWGFGSCVTGFLFLAGWSWHLHEAVKDRVTYSWFQEHFQKKLESDIKEIEKRILDVRTAFGRLESHFISEFGDNQNKGNLTENLREMKDLMDEMKMALLGTFKDKGLISRVRDMERELHIIKNNKFKES